MSHEGIRFISEEEAQRLAQEIRASRFAQRGDRTGTGPGAEDDGYRYGDRLEGRPSKQLELYLATRRLPLRHLPRRARSLWPEAWGTQAPTGNTAANVQGAGAAGVGLPGRPLRHQFSLE